MKGLNKFHTGRVRMYNDDIKLEIGEGFSDQQNKKNLFNEFDQITVYIWQFTALRLILSNFLILHINYYIFKFFFISTNVSLTHANGCYECWKCLICLYLCQKFLLNESCFVRTLSEDII